MDLEKNTFWKPTGRWSKIGNVRVQAHDPYPINATCNSCKTTFKIDYSPEKEKVSFT
jgi:hypothetical protein